MALSTSSYGEFHCLIVSTIQLCLITNLFSTTTVSIVICTRVHSPFVVFSLLCVGRGGFFHVQPFFLPFWKWKKWKRPKKNRLHKKIIFTLVIFSLNLSVGWYIRYRRIHIYIYVDVEYI